MSNFTVKNNAILLFCLITLASSCYEDYFSDGAGFLPVSPNYSLPLGDIQYDINSQLKLIENNAYHTGTYDSIEINEIIYPLPFEEFYVTYDVDFDFSKTGVDSRKIKNLFFRLIVENSFPTEVRFKMIFTDENYSLLDANDNDTIIIPPAVLNEDNSVSGPYVSVKDIPVSEDVIGNIGLLKKIVFVSIVKTKNPEVNISRFNTFSNVKIHIGMRIELDFDVSEEI